MAVKTFYWNPIADQPKESRFFSLIRRPRNFVHGNAGDSFNVDVLNWLLPNEAVANVGNAGKRVLLIGSVAHRVLEGDVVAGIGSKHDSVPSATGTHIHLLGVRGPLTLDAFKRAGHDVTSLRFMGDPGLLIGKIYPELHDIGPIAGQTIFIPHYRERFQFRSNRQYKVISIDASPFDVAKAICQAEFVYTSSLHGLIWAHALKRPALLVAPRTAESEHKYKDYFQSVDRPYAVAESVESALRSTKPTSPIDIQKYVDGITLPTAEELRAADALN